VVADNLQLKQGSLAAAKRRRLGRSARWGQWLTSTSVSSSQGGSPCDEEHRFCSVLQSLRVSQL